MLNLLSKLLPLGVICAVVVAVAMAVGAMEDEHIDKQAERVERILRKALIQCFALEGSYPAEITYLEKYGVMFDHDKFLYVYDEIFASNIMPSLVVIPRMTHAGSNR
jgi:hypothetical protein